MEVYVLFRCFTDECFIEYRVLNETDFTMLKVCERNLCARTVARSEDKDVLDKAAKELNTLFKELI
jgi:hypothetical protein